jgi:hypothetical protein
MSIDVRLASSCARALIERATAQLPATIKDRYREEWLSHYDECPGTFAKLRHAVGCAVASVTVTKTMEKSRSRQQVINKLHASLNSDVDRILSKLPEGWRLVARLTGAEQEEQADFLQRVEVGLQDFRQQLDAIVRLGRPHGHMPRLKVLVLKGLLESLSNDLDTAHESFRRKTSSPGSSQGNLS